MSDSTAAALARSTDIRLASVATAESTEAVQRPPDPADAFAAAHSSSVFAAGAPVPSAASRRYRRLPAATMPTGPLSSAKTLTCHSDPRSTTASKAGSTSSRTERSLLFDWVEHFVRTFFGRRAALSPRPRPRRRRRRSARASGASRRRCAR